MRKLVEEIYPLIRDGISVKFELEDYIRRMGPGMADAARQPLAPGNLTYLQEEGLADAECKACFCLDWIWGEWMAKTPAAEIRAVSSPVIDRGLKLRDLSPKFSHRSRHDILLLAVAAVAGSQDQILRVAEGSVDSTGFRDFVPQDRGHGELYESAWAGILKYWVLGDLKRAQKESAIAWGAYRHPSFSFGTKPIATPWLKQDWNRFRRAQVKDFEKFWKRIAREPRCVRRTKTRITVNVSTIGLGMQTGYWANYILGALAYRQGAEVATDPLWFPPHALNCIPRE